MSVFQTLSNPLRYGKKTIKVSVKNYKSVRVKAMNPSGNHLLIRPDFQMPTVYLSGKCRITVSISLYIRPCVPVYLSAYNYI